MAIISRDLPDILVERQASQRAKDIWGSLSSNVSYIEWKRSISQLDSRYQGDWTTTFPDRSTQTEKPKIPDFMRLAVEDRGRAIAATVPNVVCRPEKAGDVAKEQADKRERIIGGWLELSRVFPRGSLIRSWAHDVMWCGLAACMTWVDTSVPKAERFPSFKRLDPRLLYPDPVFTPGPFCDSVVYAYWEKRRTIEKRYGVSIAGSYGVAKGDTHRVIEYYDDSRVIKIAEVAAPGQNKSYVDLLNVEHQLERCPVTIGVRPTADGYYHSEFDSVIGAADFLNNFMTLMLDDAIHKVYAERKMSPDVDASESGPDGAVIVQSPTDVYEYVQNPNQPFTNLQFLNQLQASVRAAAIMPPSRSGDPNESIISASGISATQSQFLEDVSSIQADSIAPMLEAAIEVGIRADVKMADTKKSVYGSARGNSYREDYTPSADLGDYYRAKVVYGAGSALDDINRNVMVLQQRGAGMISQRTAMEQSPFVPDPQREEKQLLSEHLLAASLAGLFQEAQAGTLSASEAAAIQQAVENDQMSLSDAIVKIRARAALAAPPGPSAQPNPAAPGIAGAGGGRKEARTTATDVGVNQRLPLPPLSALGV